MSSEPLAPGSAEPRLRIASPTADRPFVELTGLDLRAVDAPLARRLRELAYVHQILVLRDQDPADLDGWLAFARVLGTVEPYFQAHYHHPEHPEIFVSSNVPLNGRKVGVAGTGRMWHADYSFFARPLAFTMIRPIVLPTSRRETLFVDMRRVWRELPHGLRGRVAGLHAVHDAWDYYKVQPKDVDRAIAELIEDWHREAPGATHPLVVRHPFTGEEHLYCSSGFTKSIAGVSHEDGQALLRDLFAFCEQERFVHHQPWQPGDILLWDNRSLIHRAAPAPAGEPSCSFRISLYDDLPFAG
ncbi:MAG: TauD/TfdA dioxygenase family protein [Planctomycetota bacterium]